MFVPIVIPRQVIHKTVVYSDTVLNLKESGSNIKVTSIEDVSEYELENCLKTIFNDNKDVIFNTIQYSKNNKKVYFYTDKEISTSKWEEKKTKEYKYQNKSLTILEEIKNILNNECDDSQYVSLYTISNILKKAKQSYESLKNQFENELDSILRNKYSFYSIVCLHDFDYKNKELSISIRFTDYDKFEETIFSKQNGDLYIKKTESPFRKNEILTLFGNTISRAYDEFMKMHAFKEESGLDISIYNSKYFVDINCCFVRLHATKYHFYHDDFELENNDEYNCECNSNNVISVVKGKEDEIFKKVFVKIEDTPKWMHDKLYEFKRIELELKQKEEEKKIKKQKIKKLLFPFLKK